MFLGKWRETTVAIKLLSQSMFLGPNTLDEASGAMAHSHSPRWHRCAYTSPGSSSRASLPACSAASMLL